MTDLLRMTDESIPKLPLPANTKVIAGYLGGGTPHIWTASEWDEFTVKKLPVYVHTPGASAVTEGFDALRRLYQLDVPKATAVVFDIETESIAGDVSTFNAVMRWGGYYTWVYGSESNLFAMPPCAGYWVAKWTTDGHPVKHPHVVATQDQNLGSYDLSRLKLWQYVHRLRAW